MKTYRNYANCERFLRSQPFPVCLESITVWSTLAEMRSMKPIADEVAFAMGSVASPAAFDRTFTIVSDGTAYGIQTELSRGFPGEWPHIELFETCKAAELALLALKATINRYNADSRWQRR